MKQLSSSLYVIQRCWQKNCNLWLITSIYIYTLLVRLLFLYPINVTTAKPIEPKIFMGPHVTPGKVYEWSKFQKFVFKSFHFCKILKMREKVLRNPQTFLLFLFLYCTKRRCSQIKPQLKVEKEDGREKLSI